MSKILILINGGPGLSNYISSLGSELKAEFRVVEYFQRGTPENPTRDPLELTLARHLEDLDAVVSAHSSEEVTLIAHSWGASLGLLYASKNSAKIRKLILISTAPMDNDIDLAFAANIQQRLTAEEKAKLAQVKAAFDRATDADVRDRLMNERLAIIGPTYHLDPKTEEKFSELRWNYTSFKVSIDSLWEFIDDGGVPAALATISVPVVAFHGDSDPIPKEDTFMFLTYHIRVLKLVGVKACGHFPWLEDRSRVDFLKMLQAEIGAP